MPRKLQPLPNHFTADEADALVDAAPSYPVKMAMRIMLRTGLRGAEACPSALRTSGSTMIRRSSA